MKAQSLLEAEHIDLDFFPHAVSSLTHPLKLGRNLDKVGKSLWVTSPFLFFRLLDEMDVRDEIIEGALVPDLD